MVLATTLAEWVDFVRALAAVIAAPCAVIGLLTGLLIPTGLTESLRDAWRAPNPYRIQVVLTGRVALVLLGIASYLGIVVGLTSILLWLIGYSN